MMDRRLLHLRSERGTTIVEVVVAAAVLLLAAGAVTQLVTRASNASGQQRVAAVAADLAQSELEELRAQKFASLLTLPAAASAVTHGSQEFSVQRTAEWAMESPPGATDCATSGRRPEALKVSVTVTWANMSRKPVTVDSLIAAPPGAKPTRGSYVVQLTDRDAKGVPGVSVTFQGPQTLQRATDADGCVRFNNVPADTYEISFQEPGYVDRDNVNAITKTVDVVAGTVGSAQFDYDRAGSALVSFTGRNGGTPAPYAVAGAWFVNSGVTVLGTLQNGNTRAQSPSMWPAPDAWSVFVEGCADRAPLGTVTLVAGTQVTPTMAMPQVQLRITGLPNQVDANDFFYRVASPCGVSTGVLNNGTMPANRTWQSPPITVAPGTLDVVCVYGPLSNRNSNRRVLSTTETLEASYSTTPKVLDKAAIGPEQNGTCA